MFPPESGGRLSGSRDLLRPLGAVLDRLSLGDIDRVLADVRCKVGDALEVPADAEKLERRVDRSRVGHHVREQNAKDRLVEAVDLIVACADLAPKRAVATKKRIQRVTKHLARPTSHVLDRWIR